MGENGEHAGAKANGSRRLALFFALIVVLESAVIRGTLHTALFKAAFRADWPPVEMFLWWCARLIDPMVSTVAFGSICIAAVALAVRLARVAIPGSVRDPVIRLRDFLRRHARFAAFVPWIPALLMIPSTLDAFMIAL